MRSRSTYSLPSWQRLAAVALMSLLLSLGARVAFSAGEPLPVPAEYENPDGTLSAVDEDGDPHLIPLLTTADGQQPTFVLRDNMTTLQREGDPAEVVVREGSQILVPVVPRPPDLSPEEIARRGDKELMPEYFDVQGVSRGRLPEGAVIQHADGTVEQLRGIDEVRAELPG